MSYVETACRCVLGIVFAVSALSKVRGRAAWSRFTASVAALAPAPRTATRPLAAAVVAAEGAIVLALAAGPVAPVGFAMAIGLLAAFTAAIVRAYRRERRVPCACFGSGRPVGPRHVVRNGILAAVGLAGLVTAGGGPIRPAGAGIALAAGLLCGLLLITFDDVADLFE
ncbi:MauE/DoxX family redox-associated membrane protein [Dactylosporangium sp. NPDC051485]|uniref:MauE/DoxX family redox-associated membrane protein n=1 Tax=Dactylosporangium sp. NPDC051485 TaxID=3154846 RepID=UPI00341ACFEE